MYLKLSIFDQHETTANTVSITFALDPEAPLEFLCFYFLTRVNEFDRFWFPLMSDVSLCTCAHSSSNRQNKLTTQQGLRQQSNSKRLHHEKNMLTAVFLLVLGVVCQIDGRIVSSIGVNGYTCIIEDETNILQKCTGTGTKL